MYRCTHSDWFIGRGDHVSAKYFSDPQCRNQVGLDFESGYCYSGDRCKLGCKPNRFYEFSCGLTPDHEGLRQTAEEQETKNVYTIIAVIVLVIVWIGGIIAGYVVYG